MRGVIWYQGESNADRATQYRTLFPALIQDWRQRWQQPALPFLFVQLAAYQPDPTGPATSAWAELREAQRYVSRTVPRTAMAVALDLGDVNDIHPRNKQDVGKRLAAEAMRVAYKPTDSGGGNSASASDVSRGPMFSQLKTDGNRATLTWQNVGDGLTTPDKYGYLKGFEIAGNDQKFYPARADIQGNTVVVYCPDVPNPVAVRYGWADDNGEVNLYNKAGFPAVPFRTDTWKGATENGKF